VIKKRLLYLATMDDASNRATVQVLTAGGAAGVGPSGGGKRNKNKRSKKKTTASSSLPETPPPTITQVPTKGTANNADAHANHNDTRTSTTSSLRYSDTAPSILEHNMDSTTTNNTTQDWLTSKQNHTSDLLTLELEQSERELDYSYAIEAEIPQAVYNAGGDSNNEAEDKKNELNLNILPVVDAVELDDDIAYHRNNPPPKLSPMNSDWFWLSFCFIGIMGSFVVYGLLLEYTTSGGRKLHELSFLFVTSSLYTITAAAGRHVRAETPTTIPPGRFAILGLTSMGSTFCSVRSLR
jgi:hypothetical protein